MNQVIKMRLKTLELKLKFFGKYFVMRSLSIFFLLLKVVIVWL